MLFKQEQLVFSPLMWKKLEQIGGVKVCFVWNPNAKVSFFFLPQFFNKRKTYFAHDPLQQCVVGDIVLLKALPERRSKHVKHELAEIVFKVGNVIDPITGKPCAGTRFLENLSDSENLTEADTTYLSEKLQELKVCSTDK